jgi:uncharacterized damage-inducible protein DinB
MVRVETVLDSWKTIREDAVAAVEEFPSDELDFQPIPELMGFREIARHIHDAGDGLCGLLLAGFEDFQGPQFREMLRQHVSPMPENPDRGALASALRESVARRCAELARQTPEFFSRIITRFDGMRVTRLEMLQFIKEHELTHRSQLFVYLRMRGIVPPTTRRRQAKK